MQIITNMPLIAQAFFGFLFIYAAGTLALVIDRSSPARVFPKSNKVVSDVPVWR